MVDPTVRHLLEQTIDSPLKLQLLLMFLDHPNTEGSARQIAGRIFRDMWSTREALEALAEDGILAAAVAVGGEAEYRYLPLPRYHEPIARLSRLYNEPLERDHIQRIVRDTARNTAMTTQPSRTMLELSF
ncbi:MAG TPA: hypothetical protein VFS21_21250 [Roseiflexaceae bacterium]|nr:hypothetical protein [Roseiflexaceae bacterium]